MLTDKTRENILTSVHTHISIEVACVVHVGVICFSFIAESHDSMISIDPTLQGILGKMTPWKTPKSISFSKHLGCALHVLSCKPELVLRICVQELYVHIPSSYATLHPQRVTWG